MNEQDHEDSIYSPGREPSSPLWSMLQEQEATGGTIEAEEIRAKNVVSGIQYIERQINLQVTGNQALPSSSHKQEPLFMAADRPADFVARPHEFEALKQDILQGQREQPIGTTVALHGAGGFGKTMLAQVLCHDPDIQATFRDGILWVTLGEQPRNLVGKIEDLIYLLGQERVNFTSLEAATTKLKDTLADRACLLVIDDVWQASDLTPFVQGGPRCARLITTRNDQVLPATASYIQVDAMRQEEAIRLLRTGLEVEHGGEEHTFRDLANRLGEWPLLLTLANGVLRERVGRLHEPLSAALSYLQRAFDKRGVLAFDARNAQERKEAVVRTLEVSFAQLDDQEHTRYEELAIFPEDTNVPLSTVQRLWQRTGGWDDLDTEDLCQRLASLSLFLHYDLSVRSIRLHDVVRNYLQVKIRPHLSALHHQFLDSYGLHRWSDLPPEEPYLWHHLAEHLIAAEQGEILFATMKELGYLGKKTLVCGVSAIERDLALAVDHVPDEKSLVLLHRHIVRNAHLLRQGQTLGEVKAVLLNYCSHIEDGGVLHQEWEREITGPYLTAWHPFPDPSSAALVRTLWGHTAEVNGCAISADGTWIVSASDDTRLKVWDAQTGEERRTLSGHILPVNGCAISADGHYIVSASDDTTLRVWETQTGKERLTLWGHTAEVNGCAISADGRLIVSASWDKTLKVWDAQTGRECLTLSGHTERVNGCAISANGSLIVSASWDKTLKVWDAQTGEELRTLSGHTEWMRSCAISANGSLIVSASDDQTLKVWETQTGRELRTLSGHTERVNGCAISANGRLIVSASSDKMLKVWDTQTGRELRTLSGHTAGVRGCAISADGCWIVSASWDTTLKVWDAQTGEELRTLSGHRAEVNGCAISADGSLIASASSDKTLKVWDSYQGSSITTLYTDDRFTSCVWHPDGIHLVATGVQGVYFLQMIW